MARWLLVILVVGSLLVVSDLALFPRWTYRTTGFFYPISVQAPAGVSVRTVGYYCTFQREVADFVANDVASFDQSFHSVQGIQFDALVRGYHNTSWFGLVKDIGRESVIVVRAESDTGELFVGIADLPSQEAPVTVAVRRVP